MPKFESFFALFATGWYQVRSVRGSGMLESLADVIGYLERIWPRGAPVTVQITCFSRPPRSQLKVIERWEVTIDMDGRAKWESTLHPKMYPPIENPQKGNREQTP